MFGDQSDLKNLEALKQIKKLIIIRSFGTNTYFSNSLVYTPRDKGLDSPSIMHQVDTLPLGMKIGQYDSYLYLQNISDGRNHCLSVPWGRMGENV